MEELNKQIELLKQYNISNYIVENNQITINGNLNLNSLKKCDKDFLKNTIINGSLGLYSLKECHKDFLSNTTINGNLNLESLKSCHKDFLVNTTINGSLGLYYLNQIDRKILNSNIKKLGEGFNKEFNIIYINGKLSRVYSFYEKDNWVVYKTSSGTIHQRNIITDNGELISKFY